MPLAMSPIAVVVATPRKPGSVKGSVYQSKDKQVTV